MLVASLQVGPTCFVLNQFKLTQLGYSSLQAVNDPAETTIASCHSSLGNPKQEVASIRVIETIRMEAGLPEQVRNQVEITDGAEKVCDWAELPVRVDLLQVRLGQPLGVGLILGARAYENNLSSSLHDFARENRPMQSPRLSSERQLVGPSISSVAVPELDADRHMTVIEVPRREATHPG